MPVVNNKLTTADGTPIVGATVLVKLVVSGYNSSSSSEIISSQSAVTDATGTYSLTLTGNAALSPANTYYIAVHPNNEQLTFTVPTTAGPYWLFNLLVTAPATPNGVVAGYRPTYAPTNMDYLASRNVGNFTASSMVGWRAGINGAGAGVLKQFACIGDSAIAGFNGNGNTLDSEQAFPAQLVKFLVQNGAGITHGGVGARGIAAAVGVLATGWAVTGGVGVSLGPWGFTSAGGTATYTSPQAASSVTIVYHGQSNNFSFTVGGGAANNVVPSGIARWETFTVAATVNIGTALVITAGTTLQFFGFRLTAASGIVMHNIGYGGAKLNSGTSGVNWCNFAAITNLGLSRLAGLPSGLSGVLFEAGANDIDAGADPATTAAGYQLLLAQAPLVGVPPIIAVTWRKPTTTDVAWNAYLSQCYQVAAILNAPIIDWNDRVQGQVVGQANGYLGPDNVHPTWATNSAFGKAIGDLFLS